MDNEIKVVWQTTDYQNRPVTLTTERVQHIVQSRVALVSANEWPVLIRPVIENPDLVLAGNYANTEVHCKLVETSTIAGMWLHVPVSYQLGIGDVATAIPSEKPKNREILYIRSGKWK